MDMPNTEYRQPTTDNPSLYANKDGFQIIFLVQPHLLHNAVLACINAAVFDIEERGDLLGA